MGDIPVVQEATVEEAEAILAEFAAESMESETSPPSKPKRKQRASSVVVKTSDYTGVHWSNTMNKWQAQRTVKGKTYNGGYFDNEEEAALKSDELVTMHGGVNSRAKLNFPEAENIDEIGQAPAASKKPSVKRIVKRKK